MYCDKFFFIVAVKQDQVTGQDGETERWTGLGSLVFALSVLR